MRSPIYVSVVKKMACFAGVLLAFSFLNGCANNNGDDGSANYACPVGTTYLNGGCYAPNGGYQQGAAFGYQNGFYADTYSGTSQLRIINPGKMKEFFKYSMGVCDRAGGASGGTDSCNSYVSGSMDMIIQFPSNNSNVLLATFVAQPRVNPYFNYQYSLPSGWGALGIALGLVTGVYLPDPKQYYGAYKNPLQVEMAVSAIGGAAGTGAGSTGFSANGNNNQIVGFAGAYQPGNFISKLTFEVAQGKIQDANLQFVFKINDTPAAQGVFSRCRRQNCGL